MDRGGLSGEEGSEAADREGVVSPTTYVQPNFQILSLKRVGVSLDLSFLHNHTKYELKS